MAKLTRKTQKLFASNSAALGKFGSAQTGVPILSPVGDLADMQSLPAYENGWNDAVISGLKRPPLEEFNSLKYINDYQNSYILQEGIAEYDAATAYFIGSLCKDVGTSKIYKSLIDSNIGNPLTNLSSWEYLSDLRQPLNTVIVRNESDFGVAVGSNITLANNTTYILSGAIYAPTGKSTIFLTKNLILPPRANIFIMGTGYANTDLIFTGTGTLFTSGTTPLTGVGTFNLSQFNCVDGVGTNQIWNLQSHPTFSVAGELFCTLMVFTGWGAKGILSNLSVCQLNNLEFLQCGKLTCTNIFGFNIDAILSRNFFSTNSPHFEFKTYVQANVTRSVLIPAKGESILNIDPAIVPSSIFAVGTGIGYTGNVIAGVVAYANLGGGNTRVIVAAGHSFDNGDTIIIQNSTNYNGVFVVSNVVQYDAGSQTGTFDIVATFVADDQVGLAVLLDGAAARVEPFFKTGSTGAIISIGNNGSGFARVTSTAHGRTTGDSLYISETVAYDNGYYAIVIDANNFDLLDSLGNPVLFTTPETAGTWDTGSLDQTNNVVTASNTGGILPDSQTIGNNILTTTVAFASTTTLARISAGTWISSETERFKAATDGRLIYKGRTISTVSISAKAVVQRASGTGATGFMNIMIKRVGDPSFTEILNHPSSQNKVQSSDASQLTVAAIVENISPNDELAIGVKTDSAFTLNILSIDFNIKK